MPLEPIVLCRHIIVAVFQTATEEYLCLSVCLCVCVSVCLCVCVCVHDNSKYGLINLKLKHIVVYRNCSDEFDIGQCPMKVKITTRLSNFSPFTTIQTVKSYISALTQCRKQARRNYKICITHIWVTQIYHCITH